MSLVDSSTRPSFRNIHILFFTPLPCHFIIALRKAGIAYPFVDIRRYIQSL